MSGLELLGCVGVIDVLLEYILRRVRNVLRELGDCAVPALAGRVGRLEGLIVAEVIVILWRFMFLFNWCQWLVPAVDIFVFVEDTL